MLQLQSSQHLSHLSQQHLFSQNFHQLHFLRHPQPQPQSQPQLGWQEHGAATGHAGHGLQGQGLIFGQQGAATAQGLAQEWHEQGHAAKDCAPKASTNNVPKATNVFFIINISFCIIVCSHTDSPAIYCIGYSIYGYFSSK